MTIYGRISRRYPKRRYLPLSFTLICVFYIEFLAYMHNAYSWFEPQCKNRKECTRVLLVADPQIIGQRSEHLHCLTPLTILDSDFYLRKTYYWAFRHSQPDVVIFLGDLMDEGSVASDEEFYGYVRRICDIFVDSAPSNVQHIWIPGDNDIGGEEVDVKDEKLKRFQRSFHQPEVIPHKNVTFFKINRLTMSIPVFKAKRDFYNTSRIFVGLSHVPLMFIPSPFVEKVLKKMLPQVLFTAHEHKSMIVRTDAVLRQDRQIVPVMPDDNTIFEYTLGARDMYEFIIPTCSYRMGTDKIGYGFAVFEGNRMLYTVLWSPSRFTQLWQYLVLFLVLFGSCVCWYCCKKTSKR